jgi:hypothetical protein
MNGQGSFWDTAEPNRYQPAQLWYDSTDARLVVLVNGKAVPVSEPVLPGLEVVPPVSQHVGWGDAPNAANQAHVASCAECQAKFGGLELGGKPGRGAPVVGIPQAGRSAWANKKP